MITDRDDPFYLDRELDGEIEAGEACSQCQDTGCNICIPDLYLEEVGYLPDFDIETSPFGEDDLDVNSGWCLDLFF